MLIRVNAAEINPRRSVMKKSIYSLLAGSAVSFCVFAGTAQAADVHSSIQAHLGDGSKAYASESWSAPQGALGPIRSETHTAGGANPHDLIQAHLGGDGIANYAQMKMRKDDSWQAPQGAQGPIRKDSMHDGGLFPLNATGG